MPNPPVIETQGLTKFYGRTRGINGVDIKVDPGTIFGFLGPNGAGKTTTIRLLLDFIRPSAGSARIFGLDCRRDGLEIKRRVGYLPAEPVVYGAMSARGFLEFSNKLSDRKAGGDMDRLAERLGLDLDRRLSELSRGDRQKAAIINALMTKPHLLVMDEPTTGLDPLVQQEFYALLGEARDQGTTIFFSSHVLSEVDRLCDQVGVIREGEMAAVHSISELKNRALRRLELSFDGPVAPQLLEALPQVRSAEAVDNSIRLIMTGAIGPVIEVASRHELLDIQIEETSLEDTFFDLYRQPESSHD